MSEAAAAVEKTPEDVHLEKVLADTIEAPFGHMKIAQAVQDIERVAAAGDAAEVMAKLADPNGNETVLVKALSSAWIARAKSAVMAGAKKVQSAAKVPGDAGEAAGRKIAGQRAMDNSKGMELKGRLTHVAGAMAHGAKVGRRAGNALAVAGASVAAAGGAAALAAHKAMHRRND